MLGEIVKMIQYYTDHNFPSQTILKKKWKLIFVWNYFFVLNRFGGKCPNLLLVIHYTFSCVTYFMNHETCLTLCLFHWKTFYKDSFPHFLVFGSVKKYWSTENYLQPMEKSYKNKAYILQVVFQKKNKKNLENNLSLTQCIAPINIIFF